MSGPKVLPRQQGFTEHFPDESIAIEWAMSYLRDRGFIITLDPTQRHYERVLDFRLRLAPAMHKTTFWRRLSHPACPAFLGRFGPKGRMLELRSTHALEEWLTRPLQNKGPRGLGKRKAEVLA